MGNVFLGFQGAATDVWRQDDIGQSAEHRGEGLVVAVGLLFKHVHPTTPDLPVKDFFFECLHIHHVSAAKVDEDGALFHQSKFLHADQVLVGSPAIHMQ